MIQIENYLQALISALRLEFGTQLLYVGLQGSYLRSEATENSDIDVMLIFETMTLDTLARYRKILCSLGHYDKSCGFVCSLTDLANWNALEICHLLHTTKDYYGTLNTFVPTYDQNHVRQYTKMSLNNLYHELCHCYIHRGEEASLTALPQTYKSVFFILQSLHYLRTGHYVQTKSELLAQLQGLDRNVLNTSMTLTEGTHESLQHLFDWCQITLSTL